MYARACVRNCKDDPFIFIANVFQKCKWRYKNNRKNTYAWRLTKEELQNIILKTEEGGRG